MASELESLNLGNLRLRKEYPIAAVQAEQPAEPANHPEAAAAARARIAAAPDTPPAIPSGQVPAAPTVDLITNKALLAQKPDNLPTVERRQLPSALRPMLTAVGIFAIVLLLFKSPVIYSQLKYSLASQKTPVASTTGNSATIIPSQNTITIPKINVSAPVVYEPSIQEADIQKALENGVVHYGNTAVPGQAGNTAIFGHSSNDWWEPGNYKFVFVLLDKLSPGDRLTIDYNSTRYTYEVTGSKVVEPTDVSVLNPTKEPTLTLITCTPPGTSLRRLVVTARQIDPAPSKAAVASQSTSSNSADGNLPSSAPGFFTQVGKAWNGIVHGFKSLFGGDDSTTQSNTPSGSQIPAVK